MGPDGPREELAAALARLGCETREGEGGRICVDCPDHESKCALLDLLAWRDARYDPRVRAVAARVAAEAASDASHRVDSLDLARRLHAYVCARVRYLGEGADTFQTTWETLSLGVGDCDDSARALLALARSVGLPARLVVFDRGDGSGPLAPTHASVQLSPDGAKWFWAETSLGPGVALGEEPQTAARRLVRSRAELGGDLAGVGGHKPARAIMAAAWEQVTGRSPTVFEVQVAQSVAFAETGYGTWDGAMAGSHNWGAIQCSPSRPTTGCVEHEDTHQDGTKYKTLFRTYPDDLAGAVDLVRELTTRRPLTRAALARGRCVTDVSDAMYREHYFGASCPNAIKRYGSAATKESLYGAHHPATTDAGKACDAECIAIHARRCASICASIARELGETAAPLAAPFPWLWVAGGAVVVVGAGYYAHRRGSISLPAT